MKEEEDFLALLMSQGTETPPPDSEEFKEEEDSPETPNLDTSEAEESEEQEAVEVDPQLQAYVEFLKENDLVELPEDFTPSPDNLQEVFEYTKEVRTKKAYEDILNSLPEDFKPALEYVRNGGTSVKEFLQTYSDNPLDTLDLETAEGQKKVVFLALKETSNYPDEKINKIVSRIAEDADELAAEASESFRELDQLYADRKQQLIQQAKEQQEAQRLSAEQKTQELYTAIESSTSIHPQRRNKVKSFFFDPIKTPNGVSTGFNNTINSILTNPEHQAQLADILLEYDPNAGFSLERLEKKIQTKATKQFQAALSKTLDPKQAQKSSVKSSPTTKELDWRTL